MSEYLKKSETQQSQHTANNLLQPQLKKSASYLKDNRPKSIAQAKVMNALNGNSNIKQLIIQGNYSAIQQKENSPAQRKENKTGLPDELKSGVENLSGISMDDTQVHYNSSKPAQLNAHAYAQGKNIHISPGQEKHLPHEAWHVVQQKQGRVKATKQMKAGIAVNDDRGLEHEADVMGAKAVQKKFDGQNAHKQSYPADTAGNAVQRVIINTGRENLTTELSKDTGWIIASDIQVALEQGGEDQQIFELNNVPGNFKVEPGENIYLVGHGSAGKIGHKLPKDVAPELNRILPDNYTGIVRTLNCSSAAGGGESAVARLAGTMVQKTIVRGANGVAINHPSYPNGTRVIPEDKYDEAKPLINQHIAAVNIKWVNYVRDTGIIPALFKLDAFFATLISESFYLDLEHELDDRNLLLPAHKGVVGYKKR